VNQTHAELPALSDEHYIHCLPKWLEISLRTLFGVFAMVLLVISSLQWRDMPPGFRWLCVALIAAFIFFSLYSRIWRNNIKFIADQHGLFFPCNDYLVHTVGKNSMHSWLFVPWSNVSNIRVATQKDYDGQSKCVAFNLYISPKERSDYFIHVGIPSDIKQRALNVVPVSYGDYPPNPKKTAAKLIRLKKSADSKDCPGSVADV